MATTLTDTNKRFPHFSSLPPELRNEIWHKTLPPQDSPALFFYRRKGCWYPRYLKPSDAGYDPTGGNILLDFHFNLIDHVEVKMPLIFVNREARGIGLAWTRKHGIEMRYCERRGCHVFGRGFDPIRDVLYVSMECLPDFCCEPVDRMFEADLVGRNIGTGGVKMSVAVSERLVRDEPETLPQMLDSFFGLTVLVVCQPSPEMRFTEEDVLHQRWEFEGMHGRSLHWDGYHGSFEMGAGEQDSDEALYRYMETSKELRDGLILFQIRSFEIRSGLAVRR